MNWFETIGLLASLVTIGGLLYSINHRLGLFGKIQKIRRITRKSGIIDIARGQAFFTQRIVSEFVKAKEIRILAVRGLGIFALKDSLFWKYLPEKSAQQARLRILLLSPRSRFVEVRARELGESVDGSRKGIELAINQLLKAKKRHNLNLEVRVYDELPVFRLFLMDDIGFISGFLDRTHGHDSPTVLMRANEFSFFDIFDRFFESVWKYRSADCEAALISQENNKRFMEAKESPEIFDVVDQKDNVIGQATRERCHSEKLIHRCAYVVLFTSTHKMLLFKRSLNVDKYPGFYGIIAEHVKAGESYEAAAKRGLKEELGIALHLDYETNIPMFGEQEKEIGAVFKGIYDGSFNLDQRELQKAELHPLEEVLEKFHRKEIVVTPGTSFVLSYLAASK